MQVGGSYLGMMCGGGVFLMLSATVGWPAAMLMMAALIWSYPYPCGALPNQRARHLFRMFRHWVMRLEGDRLVWA